MKKVKALWVSVRVNLRLPLFTFLFLTLLVTAGFAATYYVDATRPDDSGTGLSTAAAWKTLNKVNSKTFQPGDQILLKRGCIWREQLIPSSSGTAASPIIIDAYGTGNNPVLLGATQIPAGATWTSLGGNLYQRTQPAQFDVATAWRGTIDNSPPATSGRMRKHSPPSRDLDYDQSGSTIRVYCSTNPANYVWELGGGNPYLGNGVYVIGKSYLTIKNLDIKLYTWQGVSMDGNSLHNTIDSCNFFGNGDGAIGSKGRYTTIKNCASYFTGSTAYYFGFINDDGTGESGACDGLIENCIAKWSGYYDELWDRGAIGIQVNRITVRGCTLVGNGPHPDFASNVNADRCISTWKANNIIVENNYIYDSARAAIGFDYDPNTYNCIVRYNVIIDWGRAGQPYAIIAPAYGNNSSHWSHRIYNNTMVNMQAARESIGIYLQVPSSSDYQFGTWVRNNIFYSKSSSYDLAIQVGGDRFGWTNDGTQTIIDNNQYYIPNKSDQTVISYNGRKYTLANWMTSSFPSGCPHADKNSKNSDPQFVDLGNLNLKLSSSSPCIGAGADIGATQDILGNTIFGAPDVGAYQYQVTTTSVQPETTTSVQPETTTSVQPETTTSVQPETTTSVQPVATTSVQPEATTSVQPVFTYSIDPASGSFSSNGGLGGITVTANNNGPWTAVSNATWITITQVTATQGNGQVYYSVTSNPTSTSRQGSIIVAGQSFSISQAGAVQKAYNIKTYPKIRYYTR
jgi:hypothetical protein